MNHTGPAGVSPMTPKIADLQGARQVPEAVETEQPTELSVQCAVEPSSSGATAEAAEDIGSSRGGNIDLMA